MKQSLAIHQPPLNTTLLGVLRGVVDYYNLELSDPMLYGATGHAFLINVHPEICASGPYVWKHGDFFKLLKNLGLKAEHLAYVHAKTSESARASLEEQIRKLLDEGVPCSACNMDHQLITGYDDEGFNLAEPWGNGCVETTPARLTYGTWSEFGAELHANFFAFRVVKAKPKVKAIKASLRYAVDLFEHPDKHTHKPYLAGEAAYRQWIETFESGNANPFGVWWNAMVWSECRMMASRCFAEIAEISDNYSMLANELSSEYNLIAEALQTVGDKKATPEEKLTALKPALTQESASIQKIKQLETLF